MDNSGREIKEEKALDRLKINLSKKKGEIYIPAKCPDKIPKILEENLTNSHRIYHRA